MQFAKGGPAGPGRRPGVLNPTTYEVRAIARKMVNNQTYQRKLKADLKARTLEPSLEVMLWHYAYGKPREQMEPKLNLKDLTSDELQTLKALVEKVS